MSSVALGPAPWECPVATLHTTHFRARLGLSGRIAVKSLHESDLWDRHPSRVLIPLFLQQAQGRRTGTVMIIAVSSVRAPGAAAGGAPTLPQRAPCTGEAPPRRWRDTLTPCLDYRNSNRCPAPRGPVLFKADMRVDGKSMKVVSWEEFLN